MDGQIDLDAHDYLVIGTLVSYRALREYFGEEKLLPVYIEVEDGLRLARAVERERRQAEPKYSELCRRFLADEEDFSEENLKKAGITRRFENRDLGKGYDFWKECAILKKSTLLPGKCSTIRCIQADDPGIPRGKFMYGR